MEPDAANELPDWHARVRKVDSNLHAAFARQQREAARKRPFWKRTPKSGGVTPAAQTDISQPLPGPGY
jgi:hypothetical protein